MNTQQNNQLSRWLKKPIVTYLFLGIQTAVFLFMEIYGRGMGGSESTAILAQFGAMFQPYVVYQHEFWRFVTPIFIHIGLMHYAVNSVTLYYIGSQIEGIYGHWRFFALYLLSGIAGNVASFAFGNPASISAGASTALFGLFGAFLVLGRHFRNNPSIQFMVRRYFVFIALNLVFNLFTPSVDILGHLGGLIGGLLVATFLDVPNHRGQGNIHERIIAALIFVFLIVVCLIMGFKKFVLPV